MGNTVATLARAWVVEDKSCVNRPPSGEGSCQSQLTTHHNSLLPCPFSLESTWERRSSWRWPLMAKGMARNYREAYQQITAITGKEHVQFAAGGNGLRANRVLADIVRNLLGRPLLFTSHEEEAAFGAALIAAVGSCVVAGLREAGELVKYSSDRA